MSGSGTNMEAIYKKNKKIDIVCVFSDRDAYGTTRAKNLGLKAMTVKENFFEVVKQFVLDEKIELIILAGFLRKVPDWFLKDSPCVLNIHPSLLPKYGGKGCYGERVHEKVLQNNERFSGATVHIIDEDYDKGKILLRSFVSIDGLKTKEEIQEKVLKTEHEVYNMAINCYLRGGLK